MTRGGAREGAGRPKKRTPADASAALLTAAVYELSIGQSSVTLTLDSKSQIKPSVTAYAKTARSASATAQKVFDELLEKYTPKAEDEPKK